MKIIENYIAKSDLYANNLGPVALYDRWIAATNKSTYSSRIVAV